MSLATRSISGAASGNGASRTTCPLELPARPERLPGLRAVPRCSQVMEPAHELLLLAAEPEDVREPARRDEVLAALDRALGIPEGGADPVLARGPLVVVVHARPS